MKILFACLFCAAIFISCHGGPDKIEVIRTVDETETQSISGITGPNRPASVAIRNNTNQTFPYVFADVYYYGSDNNIIDTAFGVVTNFVGNSQTEVDCFSKDSNKVNMPYLKYKAVIESKSYDF